MEYSSNGNTQYIQQLKDVAWNLAQLPMINLHCHYTTSFAIFLSLVYPSISPSLHIFYPLLSLDQLLNLWNTCRATHQDNFIHLQRPKHGTIEKVSFPSFQGYEVDLEIYRFMNRIMWKYLQVPWNTPDVGHENFTSKKVDLNKAACLILQYS